MFSYVRYVHLIYESKYLKSKYFFKRRGGMSPAPEGRNVFCLDLVTDTFLNCLIIKKIFLNKIKNHENNLYNILHDLQFSDKFQF